MPSQSSKWGVSSVRRCGPSFRSPIDYRHPTVIIAILKGAAEQIRAVPRQFYAGIFQSGGVLVW